MPVKLLFSFVLEYFETANQMYELSFDGHCSLLPLLIYSIKLAAIFLVVYHIDTLSFGK